MILNLNKVSQVAIVVKDIEKSMKFYWEELGMGPWNIWHYGPTTTRETTYHGQPVKHEFVGAETMVGDLNIELLMHVSGSSIYRDFLDKNGEGLHHVAYATNDIGSALERFKKMGIGVIQSGKVEKDSWYYLDTESKFGIIIELFTNYGFRPPDRVYPSK